MTCHTSEHSETMTKSRKDPKIYIFENWVRWNNYIFRTFGVGESFWAQKQSFLSCLEVESDFCFCLFWRTPLFKIAISGNSGLYGRISMQKDKPIHLILLDQPYFDTVQWKESFGMFCSWISFFVCTFYLGKSF